MLFQILIYRSAESGGSSETGSRMSLSTNQDDSNPTTTWKQRRRASTYNEAYLQRANTIAITKIERKRSFSFHETTVLRKTSSKLNNEDDKNNYSKKKINKNDYSLPPPCTCPYFGESSNQLPSTSSDVVIVSSDNSKSIGRHIYCGVGGGGLSRNKKNDSIKSYDGASSVVTWRGGRRGSSIGKFNYYNFIIVYYLNNF